MLEQADLSRELRKEEYAESMPPLRDKLYGLQMACRAARVPSIIVIEGWAGADKRGVVRTLTRRLDPRYYKLHPIESPRSIELEMPRLWRFWLRLPAYGEMAIFYRSWYRRLIADRIEGIVAPDDWERRCRDIEDFERALAADGAVIVKFFLHISRKSQEKHFKRLQKDPLMSLHVDPADELQHEKYDEHLRVIEQTLARTETEWGPWTIVEATDSRWAKYRVFATLVERLEERLRQRGIEPPEAERGAAAAHLGEERVPSGDRLDEQDL
jgi:polyphosphate kinase 2 (PPK2 family)